MDKGRFSFDRMQIKSSLVAGMLPGQPIVEIAGDKRVLVECHKGVLAYSRERILVSLAYGCICIRGRGLEMTHMTRETLVITGKIAGVELQRREAV